MNRALVQRFVHGYSAGLAALVDAAGVVQERYVYGTSAFVPDHVGLRHVWMLKQS